MARVIRKKPTQHPLAERQAARAGFTDDGALEPAIPNIAYMRPELTKMLPLYEMIRDCLGGEFDIKRRDFALINGRALAPFGIEAFLGSDIFSNGPNAMGITARYLPQPNPHDKSLANTERYKQYIQRAVFYNVTKRTLEGLVGAVFLREPLALLPPGVET
jgi:hypothetical protein